MPRRVVTREEFRSSGMCCNYFQKHDNLWRLHLADGSLVQSSNWIRTDDFVEQCLKDGIYIELRDYEKITV